MLRRIAHLAQAARFQHPQQLPLCFLAQIGDLVEKQRPLVGNLEKPLFCGDCPGKRALDVPEQFTLQERRGQRGAVAGQQRVVSAAAVLMDRADDHLFAGAAFAGHQDRAIGRSDAFDQGEDLAHGGAAAEHSLEALAAWRRRRLARVPPAANHFRVAAGLDPPQGRSQFLGRAGLVEVIGRPFLDRRHGSFYRWVAAEHDYARRHGGRSKLAEDLDRVESRCAFTEQHGANIPARGGFDRGYRVLTEFDVVILGTEHLLASPTDCAITSNNKDSPRHSPPSCSRGYVSRPGPIMRA